MILPNIKNRKRKNTIDRDQTKEKEGKNPKREVNLGIIRKKIKKSIVKKVSIEVVVEKIEKKNIKKKEENQKTKKEIEKWTLKKKDKEKRTAKEKEKKIVKKIKKEKKIELKRNLKGLNKNQEKNKNKNTVNDRDKKKEMISTDLNPKSTKDIYIERNSTIRKIGVDRINIKDGAGKKISTFIIIKSFPF
jgi:hypothetical protein